MIWIIISVLCFFLFKRFISKLECKEYRKDWQSIKFPLYIWIIIVLCCFIPVMNFTALICVEIATMANIRSNYPDIRFKKGQNHWLNRLIDIMSKKY